MDSAIIVSDLRKDYGDTKAVDGVSFEVKTGDIFGIIGTNGSGKTTTVECVQALRRPDSGSVRVLGIDPCERSRTHRSGRFASDRARQRTAPRLHGRRIGGARTGVG